MKGWAVVESGLRSLADGFETLRGYADQLVTSPLFLPLALLPQTWFLAAGVLLSRPPTTRCGARLWAAGATVVGWISTAAEWVSEVVVVLLMSASPLTALPAIAGVISRRAPRSCPSATRSRSSTCSSRSWAARRSLTLPLAALGPISGAISHAVEGVFTHSPTSRTPRRSRCSRASRPRSG